MTDILIIKAMNNLARGKVAAEKAEDLAGQIEREVGQRGKVLARTDPLAIAFFEQDQTVRDLRAEVRRERHQRESDAGLSLSQGLLATRLEVNPSKRYKWHRTND